MDTKVNFAREGEFFVLTPISEIPNKKAGLKYIRQFEKKINGFMLSKNYFTELFSSKSQIQFNLKNLIN